VPPGGGVVGGSVCIAHTEAAEGICCSCSNNDARGWGWRRHFHVSVRVSPVVASSSQFLASAVDSQS